MFTTLKFATDANSPRGVSGAVRATARLCVHVQQRRTPVRFNVVVFYCNLQIRLCVFVCVCWVLPHIREEGPQSGSQEANPPPRPPHTPPHFKLLAAALYSQGAGGGENIGGERGVEF